MSWAFRSMVDKACVIAAMRCGLLSLRAVGGLPGEMAGSGETYSGSMGVSARAKLLACSVFRKQDKAKV